MFCKPLKCEGFQSVTRYVPFAIQFCLLAQFCGAAIALSGCGMQTAKSERPDWSLNGPKDAASPSKKYGDWNGPGAPKPLIAEDAL